MLTYTYSLDSINPSITVVQIDGRKDGIPRKFRIDSDDVQIIRAHRWNWQKHGYCLCSCHNLLLHRLIMNASPGEVVDHRNRMPWDNRKANLRIVTLSENQWNRGRNSEKTGVSPVKGVLWTGASWCYEIRKHGHKFKKSGFETLHEAICAKIRREYELYGDKSPNYRSVLKKMPRDLLLIYFPEIYGENNHTFVTSPIFFAHYKNRRFKNLGRHLENVRKVGTNV